jgi:hypothetical protein
MAEYTCCSSGAFERPNETTFTRTFTSHPHPHPLPPLVMELEIAHTHTHAHPRTCIDTTLHVQPTPVHLHIFCLHRLQPCPTPWKGCWVRSHPYWPPSGVTSPKCTYTHSHRLLCDHLIKRATAACTTAPHQACRAQLHRASRTLWWGSIRTTHQHTQVKWATAERATKCGIQGDHEGGGSGVLCTQTSALLHQARSSY